MRRSMWRSRRSNRFPPFVLLCSVDTSWPEQPPSGWVLCPRTSLGSVAVNSPVPAFSVLIDASWHRSSSGMAALQGVRDTSGYSATLSWGLPSAAFPAEMHKVPGSSFSSTLCLCLLLVSLFLQGSALQDVQTKPSSSQCFTAIICS